MVIIRKKNGFVFSTIAVLLSILLIGYGSFKLFGGDFTKGDVYEDSRINFLNSELKYAKDVYIPDALSFSLYSTLNALLNNRTLLLTLDKNHSLLNDLIFEGIVYGSFNGVQIISLENKTITYFLNQYNDIFYYNFKGNMSMEIVAMNIFEENLYYISLQTMALYNITTLDNISSWSFEEDFTVSVPIIELNDPDFLIIENEKIPIRPVEFYTSNVNWTLDLYNETLREFYSTSYYQENLRYTLGNSFLSKLLNLTLSSYGDVVGFWSFDYDLNGGILDSSGYHESGIHNGNTMLLYTFDFSEINGTDLYDISSYSRDATIVNDVNCTGKSTISGNYCDFDGNADYIELQSSALDLSFTDEITIVMWFNARSLTEGVNPSTLFSYGSGNNLIELSFQDSNSTLFLKLGTHNGGVASQINSNGNISLNSWTQVAFTIDGNNGFVKIYIDGILDTFTQILPFANFESPTQNIFFGSDFTHSQDFDGRLDEVAIYSVVAPDSVISNIYYEKDGVLIDIVDSLYGKAISFDSIDDKIFILPENSYSMQDYSIDLWFKANQLFSPSSKGLLYIDGSNSNLRSYVIADKFITDWGNPAVNLTYNITENKWNNFIVKYEGNTAYLYKNSKLVDIEIIGPANEIGTINSVNISWDFGGDYFSGLIDEVKFYNKSLSKSEIIQSYNNFNSVSKGCCNYMHMINPNYFGYNDPAYLENISYSAKTFYDYYNRNINLYNFTLYNLTNFTSTIVTEQYYNLLLDHCMLEAYNFPKFVYLVNPHRIGKDVSCIELIRDGVY